MEDVAVQLQSRSMLDVESAVDLKCRRAIVSGEVMRRQDSSMLRGRSVLDRSEFDGFDASKHSFLLLLFSPPWAPSVLRT